MTTETTPTPREIKRALSNASERLRQPVTRVYPAFSVAVEAAFDDLRGRYPHASERDILTALDPDWHADHQRILRSA